jgi:polysaccharide biosynthesis protein PslF
VQHEFGIYGGPDGDEVLTLLQALTVPSIVVLHTVPLEPSANQRRILLSICALAHQVVVMTQVAHDRLLSLYPVDSRKINVIGHGAQCASGDEVVPVSTAPAPQLLTWGLLGPGKGIEHVIDALAHLQRTHAGVDSRSTTWVQPRYTVAGVTHPNVAARDGHSYRNELIQRSQAAQLEDTVTFDANYRTVDELIDFVASASIVVLPYDSRDQVTSGVLVDAIAAGKPVIATAFPHAVELLRCGPGIVVPHGDITALAEAIESLVSNPSELDRVTALAEQMAPTLQWSEVARQYIDMCNGTVDATESAA